jgi:DNA ligase-associated metallophosphoesterase
VPQKSFQNDLHKLFEIIQFFKPEKLLITGDLFHSAFNKEIERFFQWRKNISHLPVILVKGNHDQFPNDFYEKENIAVQDEMWCKKKFCFTHDSENFESGLYVFSGHIHPSVHIRGLARQSLILPCFYFGKKFAILPAFGNFTGTHPISHEPDDIIFAVTRREVIRL